MTLQGILFNTYENIENISQIEEEILFKRGKWASICWTPFSNATQIGELEISSVKTLELIQN